MASTYTKDNIISDARLIFPDSAQFSDSQIIRYINWVVEEIVMNAELPEFEKVDTSLALSTSTRAYSLSSLDPFALISVKNTTQDTVLRLLTTEEAEEYSETDTGEPIAYVRFGENIRVYPLPSSDYNGDSLRILYLDKPTLGTTGSSTTGLPTYLDEAVLQGTLYRLYKLNDEPERAAAAYKAYMGVLSSKVDLRTLDHRYADMGVGIDLSYYGSY